MNDIEIADEAREKELDRIIKKFHQDAIDILHKRPAYKFVNNKLVREAWGDYINICHLHEIIDELLDLRLSELGIQ